MGAIIIDVIIIHHSPLRLVSIYLSSSFDKAMTNQPIKTTRYPPDKQTPNHAINRVELSVLVRIIDDALVG